MRDEQMFEALGLDAANRNAGPLVSRSPIDGRVLGSVNVALPVDVIECIDQAQEAFLQWRLVPAPVRGELIRRFGLELRAHKDALGRLVTLENGKILTEGLGEVQEMIDICDFAVGLSRQLYGLTIASERPGHRMMETWHPLGPVAVISAFNFPVAVWAWNFALAVVCGNSVIWKPSEKTPLCALACQSLFDRVLANFDQAPPHLSQVIFGARDVATPLLDDDRVRLVSATGSTRMGSQLAPRVAARFGRTLLELGGNNAMIVAPSADLELARRAIVFSAVGTAGQRCTSLRRLFVHESIHAEVIAKLRESFQKLTVGSPLESETLVGPLIDEASFEQMQVALAAAEKEGGTVHFGERVLANVPANVPGGGFYVRPALCVMPGQTPIVMEETFAPILYVMKYTSLTEAIELQNGVSQGLSSSVFTNDVREAETFLSAAGSDCGIANVNIGPSGAEIGGAFGGEKATGGGRESGSDAWKNYMRRATNTINYSTDLPLAQGITFDA